jgi:hypothetical protein
MADRRSGTRRNKSSRGGRPPKRLLELIREDTFRRDRHAQLIEFEPLPRTAPAWADPKIWRALRVGQEGVLRYRRRSRRLAGAATPSATTTTASATACGRPRVCVGSTSKPSVAPSAPSTAAGSRGFSAATSVRVLPDWKSFARHPGHGVLEERPLSRPRPLTDNRCDHSIDLRGSNPELGSPRTRGPNP